jgi:hypothetical protein
MKSILMTLLAMTVLTGVHSLKEHPLESLQDGGRDLFEEPYNYFEIVFENAIPYLSGCLTVVGSNPIEKQRLLLGSCGAPSQAWRYDFVTKLYHSKLNDDMCMQAGLGGRPGRGKMRLFKCDEDEALQKFKSAEAGHAIGLVDTDFCVSFSGNKADVNVDPIVLKPCARGNNYYSPNYNAADGE